MDNLGKQGHMKLGEGMGDAAYFFLELIFWEEEFGGQYTAIAATYIP